MKVHKYSDGLEIIRGDRVIYGNLYFRVIGVSEIKVALIRIGYHEYRTAMPHQLIFIKPCPWYLPWQR